ncbi:MAG: PAS domain-containing protein [Alphaproteobacteria bacterium]
MRYGPFGNPTSESGHRHAPWSGLLVVLLLTMMLEWLVHWILSHLNLHDSTAWALTDGALLGMIISALAYFVVARPLVETSLRLRESERRLLDYATTASDWFWALGPDLRFSYLSETFEAVTGRSRADILGKTWEEIGVSSDEQSLDFFFSAFHGRSPFRNFELAWKEPSGDIQWFSVTGHPLIAENGTFIGYFGTGNDNTLSRFAELEHKRSKALVDGILRTSLDGFMVINAVRNHDGAIVDFRFVHANNKAGEIVGRNKQDLLGKLLRRELPKMDEDGLVEHAMETVETGKPFDLEHLLNYENARGWFRIRGVKLEDGVVITFSDISSLKMAEQSLLDAIESLPEAFVLWDTNDRLEVCNSNFRRFYNTVAKDIRPGQTFETILGLAAARGQFEISGSSDAWLAVRNAQHHNPSGPYEQHMKDGRWLKVNDRHTSDGRTVSIHSDITDLKQRQQALVESQARLEEAQRIGHLGWWSLDVAGGRLRWSNELYHIFGGERGLFIPTLEGMIGAVHPEDRSLVRDTIDQAIRLQRSFAIEHRILRPDGTQRIVQNKGEAKIEEIGVTVQVLGTVLDITERKMIEEELRRSEERYTLAVTGSNEGIWDWDIINDKFYVSPRYREIHGGGDGGRETDLSRQSVLARIDSQHIEKYQSRLSEHLSGNAPYFSCEYRVEAQDGKSHWILERGLAIRDSDGRPYRMAGSITDVTERRAAEDRLMHTQKMEALGQLAGGVAHEFNNLLTGISGFAHMARKKPEDVERVKNCLDEVITSAERSAEITKQLLRFSRREEAKPQIIYPSTVITGMKKMLESLLGPKVSLTIQVEDNRASCRIDPGQVSQVIMNLAVNGRDAMPDGGPLDIGTRVVNIDQDMAEKNGRKNGGDHLCIYVQDHGTGIEESVLKRIFEPFFSTKEQGKGTGLGLSITYGIVDDAGGFIDVASTIGQGTTFSLYFPLVSDPESLPATEDGASEALPAGGGETILVVDDEKAVRTWVVAVLNELGYKVLSASDGVEGLEVQEAFKDRVDLLLTDVIMPRMGGVELAQKFSVQRQEARVAFMSGHTNRDTNRSAPEIPAESLLLKPFKQEALAAFVRKMLDAGRT